LRGPRTTASTRSSGASPVREAWSEPSSSPAPPPPEPVEPPPRAPPTKKMAGGGGEPNRKPDNTNFKQQTLPAWTPTLTPVSVVVCFAMIGIPFVIIGVLLLQASNSIVEYEVRYDNDPACKITANNMEKTCTVEFKVQDKMEGDVYVYYQLKNFYQNHRTYVKSRSDKQLLGTELEKDEMDDCLPRKYAKLNGVKKQLWPCGLVANSLFNDVISLPSDSPYTLDETGIAWDTDVENKFNQPEGYKDATVACASIASCSNKTTCAAGICTGNGLPEGCRGYTCAGGSYDPECAAEECKLFYYPKEDLNHFLYELYPEIVSPIVGMVNEHFIVWMRTAGLPEFRKLYGRIESTIEAGTTVTFDVTNNFHVGDYDGEKALVITTLSSVGGKNPFLGIAYMVVGVLCLILALLFGVKQFTSPRKLGDPRYLQWNDK
jgi:hypothetical protein